MSDRQAKRQQAVSEGQYFSSGQFYEGVECVPKLWVAQEALDVTVLTGGSVQLLFIDDDPLQKTFFHQTVQSTHDQKKFAFRIKYLMDFLRTTWTDRIDDLEKFKFLITYPNVVFIARHGGL